VYGTAPGIGGLGHCVSAAVTAIAQPGREVYALGPANNGAWSLPGGTPQVQWIESPTISPALMRYTWLRWRTDHSNLLRDRRLGRWASARVQELRPDRVYLLTQVALETLRWAKSAGVRTILDNPNGHIRNYWEVCEKESQRWFGKRFRGHPSRAMIERVEEEYSLADKIRVYSNWAKRSMTEYGVPDCKIEIVRQTLNLERFYPPLKRPNPSGPLRVCYVGSLDLRKGFVYLLRAIRRIGPEQVHLTIAGATGDRDCASLLRREIAGLNVNVLAQDSLHVYQQSEVLVVPTLEDGLPFVLVEGLACGLPVIVTDQAGAAECVRQEESGWIVRAADVEELTAALSNAIERRSELAEMGRRARTDVEDYAGSQQLEVLRDLYYNEVGALS
jgi:glycosyltransferase involved in cell wall biosynthesis